MCTYEFAKEHYVKMQFTPQQMKGAQRYCNKTRVGNWFEDLCLEDAQKEESQSVRGHYDEKMKLCNKVVVSLFFLILFLSSL